MIGLSLWEFRNLLSCIVFIVSRSVCIIVFMFVSIFSVEWHIMITFVDSSPHYLATFSIIFSFS